MPSNKVLLGICLVYINYELKEKPQGDKFPDKKVRLCVMSSTIAHCLYFRNASPIVFRLQYKEKYTNKDIKEIFTKRIA